MDQQRLVNIFKALGNENRLKIVEYIRSYQVQYTACTPDFESPDLKRGCVCCVDEIAAQLDMSQSTVSQHLKELYNAGLLRRHKKAQCVFYVIDFHVLEALSQYLREFAAELAQKA